MPFSLLVRAVTAIINVVGVDTINHVSSEFIPSIGFAVPQVSDGVITICMYALLVVQLWRYREFILGGRRQALQIEEPEEASRDWQPNAVLSIQDQSIKISGDEDNIRLFDPATGGVLGAGKAKVYSEADVQEACAKARKAQTSWIKTSYVERGEVLKLLNDYCVANQDLICRVDARDTGKTSIVHGQMQTLCNEIVVDGSFGEVLTTCEKISWTLANGERVLQPEFRDVGMLTVHKTARVEYQPYGVLGAIIPWNYPFHNMLGQVISAIYAGNALVLKVSEHSVWSSEFYIAIVHAALRQCGHDPNLVQIVNGFGATGAALIPAVDKLTFIGSPAVGKLVMRKASESLTPVVLELGGKDAAIVCEDCDFVQVVDIAMRGTFQNCGQNCIGLERLVVHAALYDRFVATVTSKVEGLTQGPPLDGTRTYDTGAMTMGVAEIDRIEQLVAQAVGAGARLVVGGRRNTSLSAGSFMTPTLLVDVTRDMDIARNEVFGPVMTVMKARDDDDAIAIVNSTPYGLGGSVFTLDYTRAERIGKRLRTGMCNLNDYGVNYLCQSLPFGGINISGFDRFSGVEGLRGCCNLRAVTSDKVTGVRTTIPPPLQYPVEAAGFTFVSGLVSTVYGDGLLARLNGVFLLAKAGLAGKTTPATKKDE